MATQMQRARAGEMTEEMYLVAKEEHVTPEFVRAGVAAGRIAIPANIGHTKRRARGVGAGLRVKVNANIGTSDVFPAIAPELEKLIVSGGKPLTGTVRVSGAKNAVLPIIVASMLGSGKSTLTEIPKLADVHTVCDVINSLGVTIENPCKGTLVFDGSDLTSTVAPYDLVRRMRASFLVMGPLLARKRHAKISLPGGCSIGARPIDLHLKAFEAMGAKIDLTNRS